MPHLLLTELFPLSFLNESTLQLNLGEDFSLCENDNMVFNWADFHETCEVVKKRLENDPHMKEDFAHKEMALKRLSLIPVWIRTQKKVHQTTMFDLYDRYILNQMKFSLGVDPFGPIELSFISGTGPFKEMAIAECFNNSTYKDFVMLYLLKDKLPKRDYRIRLKSKILMEYGADFSKAGLISLEQLTMNGLLLSLDSEFYQKNLSQLNELRFLIDTNCLAEGLQKDLGELRTHLSKYTFNLLYSSRKEDSVVCSHKDFSIQSSFDFLKNKKVYLFVSYAKLATSNAKIKDIQSFVSHSRSLIRERYLSQSKKSA